MSGSLPRGSLSDMLGFDPQAVQPNELLQRIQRNPVGLNQFAPSAGNQSAGFDPQVGVWNGQPITAGQAAALPVNPLSGALNPAGEMVANTLMGASSGVVPKAGAAVASGIRAYHGSPHEFDRFSTSKIGTGEGAQAYGHGLYLAESEDVARGYRDKLSPQPIDTLNDVLTGFSPYKPSGPAANVANLRSVLAAHPDKALQEAAKNESVLRDLQAMIGGHDLGAGVWDDAGVQAARRVDDYFQPLPSPGHMYEVNVRADPARFLDWDAPRDKLAPEVRAFAEANYPKAWENAADGSSLYRLMDNEARQAAKDAIRWHNEAKAYLREYGYGDDVASALAAVDDQLANVAELARRYEAQGLSIEGTHHAARAERLNAIRPLLADPKWSPDNAPRNNSAAALSQELHAAGVPGIRYLDGSSRRAGDGSRNTVVFDDATIEILRRYGLAGLLGGGAAGVAAGGGSSEQ